MGLHKGFVGAPLHNHSRQSTLPDTSQFIVRRAPLQRFVPIRYRYSHLKLSIRMKHRQASFLRVTERLMQDACCNWSYMLSMHRAAKRVKGPKQGGGKQSQGQSKSAPNYKSSGPIKEGCGLSFAHDLAQPGLSALTVRSLSRRWCEVPVESCASLQEQRECSSLAWCRAAYEQETRTTILALDKVSKVAPNGKQVLKDVGLGMYKGAKIGALHRLSLLSCSRLKHV